MAMKLVAALLALVVIAGAGVLVARSLGEDELPEVVTQNEQPAELEDRDDAQLSAQEERRASAAALKVTGGGTVAELDRSDDRGEAYEVEVIKAGREHDVALDADFRPVPNARYGD
jgi:uncharacterized membrane protein YkoI